MIILEYQNLAALITIVIVVVSIYWMFSSPEMPRLAESAMVANELVSVSLDEVILMNTTDGLRINEDFVDKLRALAATRKLVLIATVGDDSPAAVVREALKIAKLGDLVPDHRLILSEKEEGRISIVRQLQPVIHYETSQAVVSSLTGKIPNLVYFNSIDSFKT